MHKLIVIPTHTAFRNKKLGMDSRTRKRLEGAHGWPTPNRSDTILQLKGVNKEVRRSHYIGTKAAVNVHVEPKQATT